MERTGFYLRSSLLLPIAAQVRRRGQTSLVHPEKRLEILPTECAPQELPAEERRIAHHHVRLRPLGLSRLTRVCQVEQGVLFADVVERLEDRVAWVAETVSEHPLDLADPDGHPR